MAGRSASHFLFFLTVQVPEMQHPDCSEITGMLEKFH
jgi:hypothetical protein